MHHPIAHFVRAIFGHHRRGCGCLLAIVALTASVAEACPPAVATARVAVAAPCVSQSVRIRERIVLVPQVMTLAVPMAVAVPCQPQVAVQAPTLAPPQVVEQPPLVIPQPPLVVPQTPQVVQAPPAVATMALAAPVALAAVEVHRERFLARLRDVFRPRAALVATVPLSTVAVTESVRVRSRLRVCD